VPRLLRQAAHTKTLRPVVEDEITPTGVDSTASPIAAVVVRLGHNREPLHRGRNLDVLKLLQESYLGKVKIIYIDPPYNTGNDFVYRDNFTQNREEYEYEVGVYSEDGDRLFKNTETNGRFHSDWCSMIYPRLVLARNLLRDDGVIFISIDDGGSTA
jgi:adenine-specific DNA-methyltransferase